MHGFSLSNEESQGVAEKIQDAEQKLKDAAEAMQSLLLHLRSEYIAASRKALSKVEAEITSIESCSFQLNIQCYKLSETKRIFNGTAQ